MTADVYASNVVRELMAMGLSRQSAVRLVQGEERYVRRQHMAAVAPAFVAARLRGKVKRERGKEVVGLATGHSSRSSSRVSTHTEGWAGIEALHAPLVAVTRKTGMATGSTACKVEPNWQAPIYGEDMSESAIEAYDKSHIASPDARAAFIESLTSLPKVRQYFLNKKNELGERLSRLRLPGALYVEKTGNTKVIGGPNYRERRKRDGKAAAATYASISASCPDECAVRDNGCYAQQGKTAMTIRRLDKESREYNLTSPQVAASEAFSIFSSYGFGPVKAARKSGGGNGDLYLRVHVGGDSQTVAGTELIAAAVDDWHRRGGKKAWSYTHAWFKVPRAAWGPVSVLASVDNPVSESKKAREMGYAPAVVVDSFGSLSSVRKVGKAFEVTDFDLFLKEMEARRAKRYWPGPGGTTPEGKAPGTVFVPCPAQTGEFSLTREEFDAGERDPRKGKKAGVGCLDCMLCFDADRRFRNNEGIMFEAHGPQTKHALKVLDERRAGKAPRDVEME